jgi:hypothetical protein
VASTEYQEWVFKFLWNRAIPTTFGAVLSIMGGVGVWIFTVGGGPGSQNLLETGRMLVRTNAYLYIAHLFFLNAWPMINVVLNV